MDKKRIVLPESNDDRILRATEILLRRDIVDIILIGNKEKILHTANTLGLDISKATIINHLENEYLNDFALRLY